ncbi:MAG: hypothetical protein QXI12_02105 [Candidatus Methanomethyliaceae archaeon]
MLLKVIVIVPSKLKFNGDENSVTLKHEAVGFVKKGPAKILDIVMSYSAYVQIILSKRKKFFERITTLREKREQIEGDISKLQ